MSGARMTVRHGSLSGGERGGRLTSHGHLRSYPTRHWGIKRPPARKRRDYRSTRIAPPPNLPMTT